MPKTGVPAITLRAVQFLLHAVQFLLHAVQFLLHAVQFLVNAPPRQGDKSLFLDLVSGRGQVKRKRGHLSAMGVPHARSHKNYGAGHAHKKVLGSSFQV
jgi:hypothetical protein